MGGGGGGFYINGTKIRPTTGGNASTLVDNTLDLGSPAHRFKDIYLSGGVNFSANANASGMTSETLSDYEEGTWTPKISYSGGETGISHSSQFGFYTKIGNRVFLQCYVRLSALGTSTGDVLLGGFPFAQSSNTGYYSLPSVWYNNMIIGADYSLMPYGSPGNTFIRMWRKQPAIVGGNSLTKSSLGTTTDFMMSFNYAI